MKKIISVTTSATTSVTTLAKTLATTLAATLLTQSVAFGWGDTAHEAIGIIADKNLTAAAKSKITDLLGRETLGKATLWADVVKQKNTYAHTRPYHFVNIKAGMTYFDQLKQQPSDEQALGDIARALVVAEDMLTSEKTSKEDKLAALRFMVHFIGDLHQPLHAGYVEDRGGNDLTMSWYGKSSNLHGIIDSSIIKTALEKSGQIKGDLGDDQNNSGHEKKKKTPPSTIDSSVIAATPAEKLINTLPNPSAQEVTKWQNTYISDWIQESLDQRDYFYEKVKRPSDEYFNSNIDLVNTKILQSGYRLAAWLNAIFEGTPFQQLKAKKFRQEISSATGHAADRYVSLKEKMNGNDAVMNYIKHFNCNHSHY